jgi:hypothetical protein
MDLKPLLKKYNEFIVKEGKDLVVETEKRNLFFNNFLKQKKNKRCA